MGVAHRSHPQTLGGLDSGWEGDSVSTGDQRGAPGGTTRISAFSPGWSQGVLGSLGGGLNFSNWGDGLTLQLEEDFYV